MAARRGFLLIELMLALSLFMVLVYAVVRLEAAIVLMHDQIMARTAMIGTLCAVIEQGRGAGIRSARQQGLVDLMPSQRSVDKKLPLRAITITPQKSTTLCTLSLVGWVYE